MNIVKPTSSLAWKNRKSYLLSSAILAAAISLPHAILTPLLLAKGVDIAQIALIQMSYSICIFITEFPSGVLADRYSKKLLFIISNLVLICFSLIVLTQEGLGWLTLAWVLYGFSSAISSGTLENDVINGFKVIYADQPQILDQEISNFTRATTRLSLIATLVASLLGSFLYFRIDSGIYLLSILLITFSTINIAVFYSPLNINETHATIGISAHVKESLKEITQSASLKRFALFIFVSQIFFQAHFQFWQSFALEKGIPEENFYLLYILFQIIGILIGYIPIHKLSGRPIFKLATVSLVLSPPLLWAMTIWEGYFALAPYSLFVAEFWILVSYCNYALRRKVSMRNISSITSLLSSISRLGSVVSLLVLAYLISGLGVLLALPLLFLTATILVFLISLGEVWPQNQKKPCPPV